MKEIRLFAADIDNTLRGHNSTIPGPKTLEAFRTMKEKGIRICIASGRPLWQGVETHYQEWGCGEQFDYLIGLNGGEIYDRSSGKTEIFHQLNTAEIRHILNTMHQMEHINPFLYYDRNIMMSEFEDEEMRTSGFRHHSTIIISHDRSEFWQKPTGKLLFRCYTPEHALACEHFAKEKLGSEFACFLTNPTLLEIQKKEVSKGSGVLEICRKMNISAENVIAFGDAENDMEMLQIAGWSVAMANAMENVKNICDDVTEHTCENDGAGEYLFSHIF